MSIFRLPRATTAERTGITPQLGELIYDTTDNTVYLGDGVTVGGVSVGSGAAVTSVGMSVPTGLQVSGSPITSTGTLAVTYSAGYVGYTTTEQTKLSGIAPGATANSADATLLARANHTGTQAFSTITGTVPVAQGGTNITSYTANSYIRALSATVLEQRTPAQVLGDIGAAAASHTHTASQITDFNASARGQVEATVLAGANITITPAGSGATRTLTIAATGGGGVTSVGMSVPTGLQVSGSPITTSGTLALTYAAGYVGYTTTEQTKLAGIATGATANATDAALRDRATHTGTQAASTISDFNSASRAQTEAAIIAGANITITPAGSGATRTLTIASTGGGGGAVDWTVVTAGQTLADDTPLLAVITTTQSFPLPASPGVGDEFIVRNHSASTAGALVSVDPGAGRQITYGPGQALAVAETLTCAPGEEIALLCRNSTTFELRAPGAVGPAGPGGGLGGTATITLTTQSGVFEWRETVTATGVTPASRVTVALAGVDDSAQNDPEMLDVLSLAAIPLTGQITVVAAFGAPTSGPISLNWSAI